MKLHSRKVKEKEKINKRTRQKIMINNRGKNRRKN
jgi:hypothetical protein